MVRELTRRLFVAMDKAFGDNFILSAKELSLTEYVCYSRCTVTSMSAREEEKSTKASALGVEKRQETIPRCSRKLCGNNLFDRIAAHLTDSVYQNPHTSKLQYLVILSIAQLEGSVAKDEPSPCNLPRARTRLTDFAIYLGD